MVVLSRIYTRTGDDGTTALGDFSRTAKTDPRLVAYADCDETGAAIGVAIACGDLPADMAALLQRVQNDLFDVGADLCNPLAAAYEHPPLRVQDAWVDELEQACDTFGEPLATLRSFVLAGGTVGSAHLHVARTVVAPGRAVDLGRDRGLRHRRGRRGEPADRAIPEPAVRPAVHPRPAPPTTAGAATCCGSPAAAASEQPAD